MATFKDNQNFEWTLALDAFNVADVRDALGVNLVALDGSTQKQLDEDIVLLVNVLWVLCREQAQSLDPPLDDRAFGKRMRGDALEHASRALTAATADFFPPSRRRVLLAAVARTEAMQNRAMEAVMARINDPELEAAVLAELDAEFDVLTQQMLTRLRSATNTPDSSASTPGG